MTLNHKSNRACVVYALVAVALALAWQSLTVHYNFGDNWTALFCTGSYGSVPPALASEHVYRFRNSEGYDGQFYHYIAHDPLLERGFSKYVDNPRLRWRRILLPALAHIVALGQDDYIDAAYIALNLGFLFLGAYWLGRLLSRHGLAAAWSLCFLLVPATPISIDRMTLDMALSALCVGYVLYAEEGPPWKLFALLALAPLTRETGLCLLAGYGLFLVVEKRWRQALLSAAAAVPYLGWLAFVWAKTAPDVLSWTSLVPLDGLVIRMLHPGLSGLHNWKLLLAASGDYLGLVGIWLVLAVSAHLAWRRRHDPLACALYLFVGVAVFMSRQAVWTEAYSFGRIMSPLLLMTALDGLTDRAWWPLLPTALILPRIAMQFSFQALGILRAMVSG